MNRQSFSLIPTTPPPPPPPGLVPGDRPELPVAAAGYLEDKSIRGIAASSTDTYQAHLDRFIRAVGASKTLDEAAPAVKAYLLVLAQRRRAPSYRAKAFQVLNGLYRWACEEGLAELNPLRSMRAPIVPDPEVMFLADAQIHRLLDTIPAVGLTHARRDHALFSAMYASWGRVSEICRTRPEDWDLATCEVRFYGKGGKLRRVPFDPFARPILTAWLRERPPESPMMFPAKGHTSLCCSVLDRDRVARVLREVYGPAAGLPEGVTPHTLRRSAADRAEKQGLDLRKIQARLGHKTLATTLRYLCIPSPDELRGEWEKEHD